MRTGKTTQLKMKHFNSLIFVGVFIILAAVVALPVYSGGSRSTPATSSHAKAPVTGNSSFAPWSLMSRSRLPIPQSSPETIETFAADCSTPRTTFFLGETVCAVVNFVTEPDRFVNWISPPASTVVFSSPTIPNNLTHSYLYTPTVAGTWKATIADPSDSSIIPTVFEVVTPGPIVTYASGCLNPQVTFSLGNNVCVRVTGGLVAPRRISWVDPSGFVRQVIPITTDPQDDTFSVPATPTTTLSNGQVVDNIGNWRVNMISSRGSLVATAGFVVKDPNNATANLSVSKRAPISGEQVPAGSSGTFDIAISNSGPDAAQNVVLTDVVPANTTFVGMTQSSGSTFFCTTPGGGGTGTVTCTIAGLARNASATFSFAYMVNAGTAGGTLITNTATISSNTNDSNPSDNSSTAAASVSSATGGACTLDCPNNITTVANESVDGVSGAFVTFPAPETFGSCGTVTSNPAPGSFFPVGTTPVNSMSSPDGATCSFVVTVLETAPTITCPANQTINVAACAFEATGVNPGTPTATNYLTITSDRNDDRPLTDPYPLGITTITWTATDASGHTASCTQTITVNTPEVLAITCPANITVTAPSGSCEATISSLGTPTSNCGSTVAGLRSDRLPLTAPYPAGTTVITWSATDANDHVVSCTQTITVNANDLTPPTLIAPPDVTACTTGGSATVDDELGVATATDNCSASVSIVRTGVPRIPCPTPTEPLRTCESFVFPFGETIVTYTATDAAGNTAVATQKVIVKLDDGAAPTITAPANVTLYTGPDATSCGVTLSDNELNDTLGTATASDSCSGVEVVRSAVPAGNVFPVGDTLITYTATDTSGQTASANQTVTVVDNTPPVIVSCAPHVTVNTDPGACSTLKTNVNLDTPIAADNCGTVTATNDAPSVFSLGDTTVHWTVTDAYGNKAFCNQIVTVEDHENPVIVFNGQTPSMWPPNHKYQTFGVTNFVTGVTDNCSTISVSSVVITKVTSDEIENGNGDGNTLNDIVIAADCKSVQLRSEREGNSDGRVYTIFFKVTDASGNVGTASAKVVVQHNPGETAVDSGVHYTVTCGGP